MAVGLFRVYHLPPSVSFHHTILHGSCTNIVAWVAEGYVQGTEDLFTRTVPECI